MRANRTLAGTIWGVLGLLYLSACELKNECDVYPDRCPGLRVMPMPAAISRLASSVDLSFTVSTTGAAEDANKIHADLIQSNGKSVNLIDPNHPAFPPACKTMLNKAINCYVTLDSNILSKLALGSGKLQVYGRDYGSAIIYIANKFIGFSTPSTTSININQPMPPLTMPKPLSLNLDLNSINAGIFIWSEGQRNTNTVRQMNVYHYNNMFSKSDSYFAVTDAGPIFPSAMAAPDNNAVVLLAPVSTPSTMLAAYCCQLTGSPAPCSPIANVNMNKLDSITALSVDRNQQFFVISKNIENMKLQGYTIVDCMSLNMAWELDLSNVTAPIKIMLADIAGANDRGKPDGFSDVIAVQLDPLNVQVFIAQAMGPPNNDSAYAKGLQDTMTAALGTSMPPAKLTSVAAGDLDGDGLADFVLASATKVWVLYNLGDGSFRLAGSEPLLSSETPLKSGLSVNVPILDVAIGGIDNAMGNDIAVLGLDSGQTKFTLFPTMQN